MSDATTTDIIKTDSRYLHGEDLRKGDAPCEFSLTIKDVGEKDSAKSQTKQTIKGYPVTFEQTEKILVLNGTNTKLAVAALGTNSRAAWVGKKLILFPCVLEECFGQSNVICVRVRVPAGKPKPFILPRHMGKDLTKERSDASTQP